jgi:hypothetical protein
MALKNAPEFEAVALMLLHDQNVSMERLSVLDAFAKSIQTSDKTRHAFKIAAGRRAA